MIKINNSIYDENQWKTLRKTPYRPKLVGLNKKLSRESVQLFITTYLSKSPTRRQAHKINCTKIIKYVINNKVNSDVTVKLINWLRRR
jgi:hypothetical protein